MTLLDGSTCPTVLAVVVLLWCCYLLVFWYKGFVDALSSRLKEQTDREAQRWRERADQYHEAVWDDQYVKPKEGG